MASSKETQYASYSFIIIMFLVGLPLWWKTTEVYRKPLPYSRIDSLSEALVISQNVRVILKMKNAEEGQTLAKFLTKECSVPGFMSVEVNTASYTVEDETIIGIALDLSDLDASFPEAENTHLQLLEVETIETPVVMGRRRNVFFNKETPPRILAGALKAILMERGPTGVASQTSFGGRDPKGDIGKLRRFAAKSKLNVLFSLSNPDPESFDVRWKIDEGIADYLDPMIHKLSDVVKVEIVSQHIYYASLGVTPKRSPDGNGYYVKDDIPLMVNPLESRLGAQVVPGPTLHFVVLVPPEDYQPLQIEGSTSDSFLVHRWGGVMFYNLPNSSNDSHWVDMNKVMRVFTEQFRLLLGVDVKLPQGVSRLPVDRSALADWEVDFLLRLKTVENLIYSIKALKSVFQPTYRSYYTTSRILTFCRQGWNGFSILQQDIMPRANPTNHVTEMRSYYAPEHEQNLFLEAFPVFSLFSVRGVRVKCLPPFSPFPSIPQGVLGERREYAFRSLSTLLESITNIVISDHVADNVTAALSCIEASGSLYNKGSLVEAFRESLKAAEQADAAFFDPSMLALLYFPSDQKYAIYVPLFLPVGIPVLISAWSILQVYLARFRKAKPEQPESKVKQA